MFKRINFQSIPVTDQDRALAFYRDTLGLTVHTDAPYSEGWRWIFIKISGAETMIHFARAEEITVAEVPALCLISDDVDAEASRLANLGVTISQGPDDAPWLDGVRFAMIRDSESNLLLIQSSVHERG